MKNGNQQLGSMAATTSPLAPPFLLLSPSLHLFHSPSSQAELVAAAVVAQDIRPAVVLRLLFFLGRERERPYAEENNA